MSNLSLQKIESLAPDQASLEAAKKLLKPALWPMLAAGGDSMIWGECQGSGSSPYRVVVCEADSGYKCSCPSRKFPCKHSLALMWIRVEGKMPFSSAEQPAWVRDWIARRRGPTAEAAPSKPKASLSTLAGEAAEEPAPKSEARAAAARERNQKDRENSIAGGLDELDLWLGDQCSQGMLQFVAGAADACRVMAQRLVDAKASGLATRLDGLPARLFALPELQRPYAAVRELAALHLMAEAYRRQGDFSEAFQSDIRQMIGWSIGREHVLNDAAALRADAEWRVVAVERVAQPDRLMRLETWLLRQGGGGDLPRFALFLDFVPVSASGSRSPYLVGESFAAELVFYPGIHPLRALISRQRGPTSASAAPLDLAAGGLDAALADWERRLSERPWSDNWPLLFQGARLVYVAGQACVVGSGAGGSSYCLPCDPNQANLYGLGSASELAGIGLWNGQFLKLWWAQTALGVWTAA